MLHQSLVKRPAVLRNHTFFLLWVVSYDRLYCMLQQVGHECYEDSKVKQISSYRGEQVFKDQVSVTLTFDVLTPKAIGIIYSVSTIILWIFMKPGQTVLQLFNRTDFQRWPWPLTYWPQIQYGSYTQWSGLCDLKF